MGPKGLFKIDDIESNKMYLKFNRKGETPQLQQR